MLDALSRNDQVTEAINNTRSRALESLVDFGYWVSLYEKTDDVPELREILASRFGVESACPVTLPEHALLGFQFGRIWSINDKWAEASKSYFFPQDDLPTWIESFAAFIRFSRPSLRMFEVVKDDFIFSLDHLADLSSVKSHGNDATDTLGQHLFVYYLWNVYPLKGDSSLLSVFYDKTDRDRTHWGHLFDHVGRILRSTATLDEKSQERILDFFSWRVEQAEPLELKKFTFWLDAACLDSNWRLNAYNKILDITSYKDVSLSTELDSLNKMLERHTEKIVACFAKITDSLTQDDSIYIQTEKAKPILLAGIKSVDSTIRATAERARENLLKVGRFDFLEMQ